MNNKSIIVAVLFLITSAVAINFYLKYTSLNNKWNQYTDYGDIKLKLPVDSTTKAIVIASSSNDFKELLESDIDYYYITPKIVDVEGKEYSVTFTGRYNYNTNEKQYFFTISKSGEMKTMSDFRAEREKTRTE